MSDGDEDRLRETVEAARSVLAAVESLRARAEAETHAAETARQKADSESGFAFNAKTYAEEHARFIAQTRGTVEADIAWLAATRKNAEDASQATVALRGTAEADARAISEARATAEREATETTSAKTAATAAAATVEKTQTDALAAASKVSEEAAAISAARLAAEASGTAVQGSQAQVSEAAASVSAHAASIDQWAKESKALADAMSEIVARAKDTDARVSGYETELGRLKGAFGQLHAKIEGLLPGATSAGLAAAFREQKKRFAGPQKRWLRTFVAAISLLLVAAVVGLPGFWPGIHEAGEAGGLASWEAILRHLVSRLPLVGPLMWLAIYAGRNYMLALRIEEEYAFKEAVSSAFEGYKREMAGISAASPTDAPPIMLLCESVLRMIAQRPGRIYEGRQEDITPLTPLARVTTDLARATTDLLGVKKRTQ